MRIYDAGALTHHWDNDARTVTDYTTTPPVVRPYTADENAVADAAAAATAAQQVAATLTADATADEAKITQAIEDLRILLGDNATVGSLRAWKRPITNGATLTGAQGKALADLIITQAQATRRVARQTLRLARFATGEYDSADVGTDV